jgi:hypothetical protein
MPANVNYEETQRSAGSALPGTVNYIEGQVAIGGHSLNSQAVGSAELQAGQSLTTREGKAELLLTPGVFLRVDDHSSVQMVSPSLTRTEARLVKGQAMVEVEQIHRANDLLVAQNGATTRLLKKGLYDFDAARHQVRVFQGQAQVREGDQQVKLGGSHEVTLNTSGKLKSRKFDKKAYEGDLYRFSKLRSDYLAEASANAAPQYVYDGWYGPGWYGPGWYWDSWFDGYTFIPGAGILYSPFGWGFYSPLALYETPFIGRRFGDHGFARDHGRIFVGRGSADRGIDRGVESHETPPARVAPAPGDIHRGPMAMNAPRPEMRAFRPAMSMPRPAMRARMPAMSMPRPAMRARMPAMSVPHGGGFRGGFRGGMARPHIR